MSQKIKLARDAMLAKGVVREIQAEERVENALAVATLRAHNDDYWDLRVALNSTLEWALVCAQPRRMQ